jgi:thioredoxin reductase
VLFNTNPVKFTEDSTVLDVHGQKRELPNDFVWIFAGGVPPYDFLKKIGIRFGMRDMTQEASSEARRTVHEKKELAKAGTAFA